MMMSDSDDDNSSKDEEEKKMKMKKMNFVLALGVVCHRVVAQGAGQKRIDRKRKAARSRNQP